MTDEEKNKEPVKKDHIGFSTETNDEKPEDKKDEPENKPTEAKPEQKPEAPKEPETPKSPSEKAFEAGYTGIVEYAKSSDDPTAVLESLKQMTTAFNTLRQNNINLIDTIGKKYQEESDEKLDHKYEQQKVISMKDIPFKIQRSE